MAVQWYLLLVTNRALTPWFFLISGCHAQEVSTKSAVLMKSDEAVENKFHSSSMPFMDLQELDVVMNLPTYPWNKPQTQITNSL